MVERLHSGCKNDAIGPLTSWSGGAGFKPLAFVRLNMGHLYFLLPPGSRERLETGRVVF